MAGLQLSHLSRQCLDRRIPDQETLAKAVLVWCKQRNQKKVNANWQFTTQDARIKLKKLYPIFLWELVRRSSKNVQSHRK